MCIRDSSLDDIINDKVDEWGLRYGLFESIQIIIDLACSIAVSYTHLRAHETVLDLVCRLLLEKKKTNKTYKIYCDIQRIKRNI